MARPIEDEASQGKQDGNSLIDAIMNKYGNMESGLHDMGDVKIYFSAPAKKTKSNEDESSEALETLKLPSILVLNRCGICRAGDEARIADLCWCVQELDLAENSLDNWDEILTMASKLPNLEFLNLSSNPLHIAAPVTTPPSQVSLENIQKLVLNNTKLPWESIHSITRLLNSLEELHLSLNGFSEVGCTEEKHPKLKLLQFNNNQVGEWEEVQKLGIMFPGLETLILMHNPITNLGACPGECFPQLKMLCISNTLVNSWDELEKLNEFPSLTEANVRGIPLLHVEGGHSGKGEKKLRQLVVARLGKLEWLNRSPVTETEREQAERMFIRKFRESEDRPSRYEELVAKHGNVQELAKVDMTVRTKYNCKLDYEGQLFDITVNTKHNIGQLKKQIESLIGLPPSKFRVFYYPNEERRIDNGDLMRFNARLLHNWEINDGDCFRVYPNN